MPHPEHVLAVALMDRHAPTIASSEDPQSTSDTREGFPRASSVTVNHRRRWTWKRTVIVALTSTGVLLASGAYADDAKKPTRPAKGAASAETKDAKAEGAKEGAKDKKKDEASADERAARGVVTIERGGQVLALGTVLSGDGRILTALSPLGHGNDLDARFADGTTVRVKIGHHDRVWDLALVVPQMGRWTDGLTASSRDPVRQDASIHAFTVAKSKAAMVSLQLRAHRTLIGGDDRPLENAIEIGGRVAPTDLGSPIVDEDGRVVGLLARGCAPNENNKPCTPVAFGAPMNAIRSFLRTVPATAVAPQAWLGIQGVAEAGPVAKGVRVLVVHPESPADDAHLKGGDHSVSDMVLAVDGVPVASPEQLADVIRSHAVGEKVPLTIFGQGKYRTVTVLLRTAPDRGTADSRPRGGESESRSPGPPPTHPAELPPANDGPAKSAPKAPPAPRQ